MTDVRLARVLAFYNGRTLADIICMDGDGMRFANVPVMYSTASTKTIAVDLPTPSRYPTEDAAATTLPLEIVAIVLMTQRMPIVIGFLPPILSQCLFDDPDRLVHRHSSDVYWTVDQLGNTEYCHPSGVFVRIGAGTAHEDLTGKDRNKTWAIAGPGGAPPSITVSNPFGTTFVIAPNGDVTLTGAGAGAMTFPHGLTITADIALIGNLTQTGNQIVSGDIAAAGNISDSAGSMESMRGVYNSHHHSGVQSGPDSTSTPSPTMPT